MIQVITKWWLAQQESSWLEFAKFVYSPHPCVGFLQVVFSSTPTSPIRNINGKALMKIYLLQFTLEKKTPCRLRGAQM